MIEQRTTAWRGAGGIRIAADEWGDADAPAVILLHGAGQNRHSWGHTAGELARAGWRVIAVDQRGHGDSEWSKDGAYDFTDYGADLRVLLAQLQQPPAVVGASLGGLAALTAQQDAYESLYSALVLVDITPRIELAGARRIIGFMVDHPEGFPSLEVASEAIAAFRPNKPRPTDLRGLAKVLRQDKTGRWRWHWDPAFLVTKLGKDLGGLEALQDRAAGLADVLNNVARRLTVPTLLVRGAISDVVGQDAVDEFLDLVPHAEFVDVAGAGHMVAGDQNDAFTDAVAGFLERVRATWSLPVSPPMPGPS